jgi:hypothetical protein
MLAERESNKIALLPARRTFAAWLGHADRIERVI